MEDFTGNDAARQKLAAALNLPVTVFVRRGGRSVRLRFFYPAAEFPLCAHGTLAAAFHLLGRRGFSRLNVHTGAGTSVVSRQKNGLLTFACRKHQRLNVVVSDASVRAMLRLRDGSPLDRSLPLCAASIGSPKLLVPFLRRRDIDRLRPDYPLIRRWSAQNKVNGIYAYTRDSRSSGSAFYARAFHPLSGNNEDAATGVAAAALVGSYAAPKDYGRTFFVEQGYAMGRSCRIAIGYHRNGLTIGGFGRKIDASVHMKKHLRVPRFKNENQERAF
ncbi:MAG: PhzF family phenazine biosynthesis protein [Elusimicrobia bacterium]|nr:PhzF family phenazine biosynthesis protein [Elusimicrobiota bacterium]